MQKANEILAAILDCGTLDVDMLLETKIDIVELFVNEIDEGIHPTFNTIMEDAYQIKVAEIFENHSDVNENDFQIYSNCLDTHIYISNNYEYYLQKYSEELEEIEDYMNLQFEN